MSTLIKFYAAMKFKRWLMASYLGVFLLVGPFPFQLVGAASPVCTRDETSAFMQDLACTMLRSKRKATWPVDMNVRIPAQVFIRHKDGSKTPAFHQEVAFIHNFKDINGKTITQGMKTDVCNQEGKVRAYYTERFYEGYTLNVEIMADYPKDDIPRKKVVVSANQVESYLSYTGEHIFEYNTQVIEIPEQ